MEMFLFWKKIGHFSNNNNKTSPPESIKHNASYYGCMWEDKVCGVPSSNKFHSGEGLDKLVK